jgi:uncharacterized protein
MTRRPFVLDVVALRRHPGYREAVVVRGRIPGLAVTGAAVPDAADVAVEMTLEAVEGAVVATGRICAPWVGECRRCLAVLHGEAVADVEEVFVAEPEEGETWPLVHDQIDLEPIAREAVVLELPLAPLCRPDCEGLCPMCGADLNLGPCGCPPQARDPRWAPLDVLRPES